jgi:hypothetical protein
VWSYRVFGRRWVGDEEEEEEERSVVAKREEERQETRKELLFFFFSFCEDGRRGRGTRRGGRKMDDKGKRDVCG